MSAYVVVQVDIKDPVRYADYKEMVPASLEKYGGRFLVRGGKTHTLEGAWAPKRFVIACSASMVTSGIDRAADATASAPKTHSDSAKMLIGASRGLCYKELVQTDTPLPRGPPTQGVCVS